MHFWGNYLFQAGKTIDEDKALDTQLHDTKTACMYANIFILNRTCCMLQHALQYPEGGLIRLSWAAYNYAVAPTFMNNNRPQHQELGSLLSGEMWVGFLTSLTNQYRKNKGEGDLHVLYPKILEHETIFRCKSKGSTFSSVTIYFKTLSVAPVWDGSLNPWSPTSDLERISPYTISTISSRQVMRKKKNIN